jgi:hypothetical protein
MPLTRPETASGRLPAAVARCWTLYPCCRPSYIVDRQKISKNGDVGVCFNQDPKDD